MNEDFLHYVWQQQYFDKSNLQTSEKENILIIRPGMLNTNAGPDFSTAQVKIGEVTWNGSVEIHLKSSDWLRHNHQQDLRYDQVILHVVWQHDQTIARSDGTALPTLELQNRISPALLNTYKNLKKEKESIPCAPFLPEVPELTKVLMLERVLLERIEQKSQNILNLFNQQNQDWEAATYSALLQSFGFKINQVAFSRLSLDLPFSIIRKHNQNQFQLEALLFGQAGFLENISTDDEYLFKLQKEFKFLELKYNLSTGLIATDWNFLRLRPANFPTVRLAQLAAFLSNKEHLLRTFLEIQSVKHYYQLFNTGVSDYWETHYMPGRANKKRMNGMGLASRENILINTIVPLLFAYGRYQGNQSVIDKSLILLEQVPSENNWITRIYEDLGFEHKTAGQSQSFIQLNHQYCSPRKCLYCSIGHQILKNNLQPTR